MATIFRIQDRNGRGPWRPGFSRQWVEERADHERLVPWMQDFPGLVIPRAAGIGVGCRTLDQLRRWFTKSEYLTLRRHHYRAVALDRATVIAESDIQVVFTRAVPNNFGHRYIDLYGDHHANA